MGKGLLEQTETNFLDNRIRSAPKTPFDVVSFLTFALYKRVARLFLAQHTKTVKTYKMAINYTKWPQIIPNGHKIYQMATKYIKWPQNIPNGHKIYQMAVKYTKWQ
jgi:hypothetical protein